MQINKLLNFKSACGSWRMRRPRYLCKRVLWLASTVLILSMAFLSLLAAQSEKDGSFGDHAVWRWPPIRAYHVKNYRLVLRFDEPKGEVFGDETVTLQPFEAHFRKFYLDSTELAIESVMLLRPHSTPVKLGYVPDNSRLWITLDRDYDANTTLQVRIVYHGFPRTGLFFVNPTRDYPSWPREVFSQGEPEFNHYWFPCWDYPNDMATSETVTTVPEGQSVVSNGKLVSVRHAGTLVTYDWVESIPHSSYLVSVAVGPWRKVTDKYKDTPVDYYVPDSVDEATARRSFHLTPDMIGFFSRATGVEYPYEQYAQVTVQNFIFGGQENVSATTLTDTTLHDERADEDYPSTNLVSHELGQHWFGDLVQSRDWANIWLNEGFATYLEALYTQHQDGYDAYRFAIYQDQLAEQKEDRNAYRRPIVDRHYDDPLAMFDATTHEKGAAVLDMLRYVVDGSDATSRPASQPEPLFRAFHRYLSAHKAQTAETADLMDAIREATGEELGWFFRQWVSMSGRPEYRVEAGYDAARKEEKLTITQTQRTSTETPIFDMPIELAFHGVNGERKKVTVRDHLQRQAFEIPLDFEPRWVAFDPDDFIDKTLQFDQPLDALVAEATKDPSMMSRLWAAEQLGNPSLPDTDARTDALELVLGRDAFYAVRATAAASLGKIGTSKAKVALLASLQQSDTRVRKAAVAALSQFTNDPAVFSVLVDALRHDSSYAVKAAAAEDLGRSGVAQAFDVLQAEAQSGPEIHVMQATLNGLATTKDPRAIKILLSEAQPGKPERVRLYALAGLGGLNPTIAQSHLPEVVEVVRAALHDPFYPVRAAGQKLVGSLRLSQFEVDMQIEAEKAPMAMQRKAARKALFQLHHRE